MMQQYKQFMLLRCRGSLSLRSCTLLTLSTHPPPSSPVTTSPCIRHHSRDTSAVLPRPSFHVVPCTGHIRQPANLFHTSPSSPADDGDKKPEKEEKKIHSMWRKFATLIQNFTAGVKTLYSEVKLMSEYKQKHGNLVIRKSAPVVTEGDKTDLLYSRKELQFMYRV